MDKPTNATIILVQANFRTWFSFFFFIGTGNQNRSTRRGREKSDRLEIADMKARMKQASEASLKYNGDQTNTSQRTTEDSDSEHQHGR